MPLRRSRHPLRTASYAFASLLRFCRLKKVRPFFRASPRTGFHSGGRSPALRREWGVGSGGVFRRIGPDPAGRPSWPSRIRTP